MQLEGIDEDGGTKIDISELRTEIERLREAHKQGQLTDDFNPALLVSNALTSQNNSHRQKKSGRRKKKSKSGNGDEETGDMENDAGNNDPVPYTELGTDLVAAVDALNANNFSQGNNGRQKTANFGGLVYEEHDE